MLFGTEGNIIPEIKRYIVNESKAVVSSEASNRRGPYSFPHLEKLNIYPASDI